MTYFLTRMMKNRMIRRARTWMATRKAREFMYQSGIDSLPVDPFELYTRYGWKLRSNSYVENKYMVRDPFDLRKDKVDAYTFWDGEQYMTVYDDRQPMARIRWTLAHEIGHIFLGHLLEIRERNISLRGLSEAMYQVLEKEANFFAKELLTPLWLLKELNVVHREDISMICSVSGQAAEIRELELIDHIHKKIHIEARAFYRRQFNEFLTPIAVCAKSDIEIPFGILNINTFHRFNFFCEYDDDNSSKRDKCPKCGNQSFSINADYCKCCGTYLYWKRPKHIQHCNAINSSDAKHCEKCGSPTYSLKKGLLPFWLQLLEWNGEQIAVTKN